MDKPELKDTAPLDSHQENKAEVTTPKPPAKTVRFKPEEKTRVVEAESKANDRQPAVVETHKLSVEVLEGMQSTRNRVKSAARGIVEDNVRPRVEKLRHASSAVFEEAAIDPSLRFVLIALILFILFIVLLLFSMIK